MTRHPDQFWNMLVLSIPPRLDSGSIQDFVWFFEMDGAILFIPDFGRGDSRGKEITTPATLPRSPQRHQVLYIRESALESCWVVPLGTARKCKPSNFVFDKNI